MGAVTVSLDMTGEYEAMNKASAVLWIGQAVVQMLLFFVIGWLINQVTRPTRELQQIMLAMQTDGDLSRRVAVHSKDEVGQTAVAFNALIDSFSAHHPASAGRRGQDQQDHQPHRRDFVGSGGRFARAKRGGFIHRRGSGGGDGQHQFGRRKHQCRARTVRKKPAADRAGQSQRGRDGARDTKHRKCGATDRIGCQRVCRKCAHHCQHDAAGERHRQPDQFAGIECRHRGGPCRRAGSRLRRGGRRSAQAGGKIRPVGQRDRQGDQQAGREIVACGTGHRIRRAVPANHAQACRIDGRRAERGRCGCEGIERGGRRDRCVCGRTGCRKQRDHAQHRTYCQNGREKPCGHRTDDT